jgi:hypothetical protein
MQKESTNHAESTDDPQNIRNSQMINDKLMGINGIIKEASHVFKIASVWTINRDF